MKLHNCDFMKDFTPLLPSCDTLSVEDTIFLLSSQIKTILEKLDYTLFRCYLQFHREEFETHDILDPLKIKNK